MAQRAPTESCPEFLLRGWSLLIFGRGWSKKKRGSEKIVIPSISQQIGQKAANFSYNIFDHLVQ